MNLMEVGRGEGKGVEEFFVGRKEIGVAIVGVMVRVGVRGLRGGS